jgi:hypothetical protein
MEFGGVVVSAGNRTALELLYTYTYQLAHQENVFILGSRYRDNDGKGNSSYL